MLKKISTEKAPAAIGPYSQGIVVGNLLFSSGQIALDPQSGEIVGEDVCTQTEQIMKNLSAVLEAAGSDFDHIIKTTCFLAEIADFADFNEVYGRYITSAPARDDSKRKALP